jgi:SAM-dependent methyltransferase
MSDPQRSRYGSQTWEPGFIGTNLDEQGGYLERVAATDAVQRVAAHTMQALALQTGQKVLEVGCGNGVFLPRLAEAVGPGGAVVGVDHAEAFVAQARRKMADTGLGSLVKVQVGDACALPFPDGTFDAAHCERVLMHLADPTAALREMARVVRPGGRVVAVEPDWGALRIDHPDPAALALVYDRMKRRNRDSSIGLALRRLMVDAGLADVTPTPVFGPVTDYGMLRLLGFDFDAAVQEMPAQGEISIERLNSVVPAMEAATRAGHFYATGGMHVMCGTAPLA